MSPTFEPFRKSPHSQSNREGFGLSYRLQQLFVFHFYFVDIAQNHSSHCHMWAIKQPVITSVLRPSIQEQNNNKHTHTHKFSGGAAGMITVKVYTEAASSVTKCHLHHTPSLIVVTWKRASHIEISKESERMQNLMTETTEFHLL